MFIVLGTLTVTLVFYVTKILYLVSFIPSVCRTIECAVTVDVNSLPQDVVKGMVTFPIQVITSFPLPNGYHNNYV